MFDSLPLKTNLTIHGIRVEPPTSTIAWTLFIDLRVAENLLGWLEGRAEEDLAECLETCASERGVEVDTLEERVDFDRRLGGGRESALGTLASGTETAEGAGIRGEICGSN